MKIDVISNVPTDSLWYQIMGLRETLTIITEPDSVPVIWDDPLYIYKCLYDK